MLVLCFESEAAWRACCDKARMRQRWGKETSHNITRRLQQLEAMASLDDLSFMPFASVVHSDGVIELVLDDETSLFVREVDPTQEDGILPTTHVMVTAVGARIVTDV